MDVVHLGFSGFPKGLASVQRLLLTFKGLKYAGKTPWVINKISHHQEAAYPRVKRFQGIPYVQTSWSHSRPVSFFARNLNKPTGYFGELKLLYKKRRQIDSAVLYSSYFLEYPYYYFLSRIFRFKLVIQYVELFSSIPGRQSFFTKLNDRLIDQYIGRFCDGIIVISNYIADHVKKISPTTPFIKLPAITDFDAINAVPVQRGDQPYLMYCGTIHYDAVIGFIIQLFDRLKKEGGYGGKLLLIISGNNEKKWADLKQLIANNANGSSIVVESNIPHNDLVAKYKGADMLLIPLRKTVQDTARFPHKIGEYCAARRPLVSTNTGEAQHYFKDGVSALLAADYTIAAYYDTIVPVLNTGDTLDKIGEQGYATGYANFDYKAQGKLLATFIDQLSS